MPLELDYYYGNEAEQYSFYRIPKVLFTDSRFKAVSVEAKVLYGLLLDRMALSVKTGGWTSTGAFISFTPFRISWKPWAVRSRRQTSCWGNWTAPKGSG